MKSSSNIIRGSKGMGDSERRGQIAIRRSQRLLALRNPELVRNPLGLRRSPRLHTESAMISPRKPGKSPPVFCFLGHSSFRIRGSPLQFEERRRFMRQSEAKIFKYSYTYGSTSSDGCPNITEKRHIVVSGGELSDKNERSHGLTWVGVHGINSICAVYKNYESEVDRICDLLGKNLAMRYFWKYILSQMEDLPDLSTYSKDLAGKPFAVVSVHSVTGVDVKSCDKALFAVPGEDKAVEFLKGKMNGDRASLTDHETQQTAIVAFQHLYQQEFKAGDFLVVIFECKAPYTPTSCLLYREVEEHLAVIKQQKSNDTQEIPNLPTPGKAEPDSGDPVGT